MDGIVTARATRSAEVRTRRRTPMRAATPGRSKRATPAQIHDDGAGVTQPGGDGPDARGLVGGQVAIEATNGRSARRPPDRDVEHVSPFVGSIPTTAATGFRVAVAVRASALL